MLRNNKFTIAVALIILYASLTSSHTFDEVPFFEIPYLDKIIHFGMYFVLMSVTIFENRKNIRSTSGLFMLALFPFIYGIIMEILQITITETRSGDFFDFLSNTLGTLTSLLLWIWIKPSIKERIR